MKGTPVGHSIRTRGKALAGATVAAGALTLGATHADAAGLQVTNTHPKGKGSFAAALKRASKDKDFDTIRFDDRVRGEIKLRNFIEIPTGIRIVGAGAGSGARSGRVVLQGPRRGTLLKLTKGDEHVFEELDLDRVAIRGAFPEFSGAQLTITRSTLSGHGTTQKPGVDMIYSSRYSDIGLTISESTIEGFLAGVRTVSTEGRIGRSTIRNNEPDGGVFAAGYSNVDVVNSTISGNELDLDGSGGGGGVRGGYYASVDVFNSTITGNSVTGPGTYGGGVAYDVDVYESTISGNTAPTGGGVAGGDEDVELSNSIVFGNHATDPGGSADCAVPARVRSKGGNLIGEPGDCATRPDDLIGVDPLLDRLRRNGGPTPTMAIPKRSPAIGFAIKKNATKADQRGVKRGKDPDSGAYEFNG